MPLDDPRRIKCSRTAPPGIFQFESSGMHGILHKAKLKRLGDLIALSALKSRSLRAGW